MFLNKIKELKSILRIPRLYDQYRKKLQELKEVETKKDQAYHAFRQENQIGEEDLLLGHLGIDLRSRARGASTVTGTVKQSRPTSTERRQVFQKSCVPLYDVMQG